MKNNNDSEYELLNVEFKVSGEVMENTNGNYLNKLITENLVKSIVSYLKKNNMINLEPSKDLAGNYIFKATVPILKDI